MLFRSGKQPTTMAPAGRVHAAQHKDRLLQERGIKRGSEEHLTELILGLRNVLLIAIRFDLVFCWLRKEWGFLCFGRTGNVFTFLRSDRYTMYCIH